MPFNTHEHLSEEAIQDYLEGIMSEAGSQVVENHLNSCQMCLEKFNASALISFKKHFSAQTIPSDERMASAYKSFKALIKQMHENEPGSNRGLGSH